MSDITRARRAAAILVPLLAPALLAGAVAAEPATSWRHGSSVRAPTEHIVRMVVTDGAYRFEPAEISASPGDRVTFVNESGGPHNVAFDAAKIDDALEAKLAAGMPSPMSPLAGPLLTGPGARYTITLDGVAPGAYPYYCMPHYAMKMTGTLTVR
jgi:plastocyanin